MDNDEADELIDFAGLVRASDTLDWLTARIGSRTLAKRELADAMRDGKIRTFALRAWDTTERVLIKAWAREPNPESEAVGLEENLEVLAWVWRRSRQWQDDQANWRWPSGRFTSVVSLSPYKRILVEHVHFDQGDILHLATSLSKDRVTEAAPICAGQLHREETPPVLTFSDTDQGNSIDGAQDQDESWSESSKGVGRGRPLTAAAWAAIIIKLYELKSGNSFSNGSYRLQKTLTQDLIVAASAHGKLGETKIKPVVSALYKAGFVK